MSSELLKKVFTRNKNEWRDWLDDHHDSADEIWLVFYKVHTRKAGISYDDAVEEALCFGWIDGKVKRIDDEKYMFRFTPRRKGSEWSRTNVNRAERLIREKRMTEAGLAQVRLAKKSGRWEAAARYEDFDKVPPDLAKALSGNKTARENFENFAPGYRREYIRWILNAKRKETRKRRLREVVKRTAANIKPGIDQ